MGSWHVCFATKQPNRVAKRLLFQSIKIYAIIVFKNYRQIFLKSYIQNWLWTLQKKKEKNFVFIVNVT